MLLVSGDASITDGLQRRGFITNLEFAAITAYKKRFCIEEMFRDCKSGGYNLEGLVFLVNG